MKRLNLYFALVLAFVLAACANLGVQSPATFNQKVLAAHATVTAIANSASTLRAAGKLSDADRDNVVASLRSAEAGIDIATMTYKTNAQAGADKLAATITVLTALQTYLATKGTQ